MRPINAFHLILGCLLILLGPLRHTNAQGKPDEATAVGDGRDFWLLRDEGNSRFVLFHRNIDDPPAVLRQALTINAQAQKVTLCAADRKVYLFYKPLNVQRVRAIEPGNNPTAPLVWNYAGPTIVPSPPKGVSIRSTACSRNDLWALVRVETREALDQLDNPPPLVPGNDDNDPVLVGGEQQNASAAPNPQAPDSPVDAPTDPRDTPTASIPQQPPLPVDRLIHLVSQRWESVPLPDDWSHDSRAWIALAPDDTGSPILLSVMPSSIESTNESPLTIKVYTPQPNPSTDSAPDKPTTYTQASYTLPPGSIGDPLIVAGQLVVPQIEHAPDALTVRFHILRDGRSIDMGSLISTGHGPNQMYALAVVGESVALVVETQPRSYQWSRIDLNGRVTEQNAALKVESRPVLGPMGNYLLVVGVLAIASIIHFVFWRKDPDWNKLELPNDWALAPLGNRAIAALIDMAPCTLFAAWFYDITFTEVLIRWPGRASDIALTAPGAVAIALFISHTCLGELFTATTLGKKIMGLRTMSVKGRPPNLWQTLTRCALKSLDLIALPLLIMPAIGPMRQRLGDLVARTVVVTRKQAED
ncbi:MAG: hypothetical protein GC164_13990 [Phycisphaera sp.]|nr:hypothetical protein [Phycisphaera sp.]